MDAYSALLAVVDPSSPDQKATARPGEIVMPSFVPGQGNSFLGLESFMPANLARIGRVECDPNAIHARLCQQYPGLPAELLGRWLTATIVSCAGLPRDTVFRTFADPANSRVVPIDADTVYIIWSNIDTTRYI